MMIPKATVGSVGLLLAAAAMATMATNPDSATISDNRKNNNPSRYYLRNLQQTNPNDVDTDHDHNRWIIECKPEDQDDLQSCLQKMQTAAQDRMAVKHTLSMGSMKAYAVEMNVDTKNLMESSNYQVVQDEIRSLEYFVEEEEQDANEDSRTRLLQNINDQQLIPFGIDMVDAPRVWEEFGVQGEGVRICVMDSGLTIAHSDWTHDNIDGYDGEEAITPWFQDADGHGTHVTGTIAAADNTFGVVGVAPQSDIYIVRVFDNEGNFFASDIIAALQACYDANVDIISMSLGGPRGLLLEQNAFDFLYSQGIMSVAAAGNDGTTSFSFPASYDTVVSVAAVDQQMNLASFSQRNSGIDLAGPGVRIASTNNLGGYSLLSGTSMACPHVTGVMALLMSYNTTATLETIQTAVKQTAHNPNRPSIGMGGADNNDAINNRDTISGVNNDGASSFRDDSFGFGIVNAYDAIQYMNSKFGPIPDDVNDDEENNVGIIGCPGSSSSSSNQQQQQGIDSSTASAAASSTTSRSVTVIVVVTSLAVAFTTATTTMIGF